MFNTIKYLGLIVIVLFSTSPIYADWIEESNTIAEEFTLDIARFYPEFASSLGYRQFDALAQGVINDMELRDIEFYEKWLKKLSNMAHTTEHPELKLDIEIFLDGIAHSIEGLNLDLKHGVIHIPKVSQEIYGNLQALINPQSDTERKAAAIDRFKAYVHGFGDFQPLITAYKNRIVSSQERFKDQQTFYPLRTSIEQYLADSPSFVEGVRTLLAQSGRDDWKNDYEIFKEQVATYDSFLKEEILPKTRTDYALPKEIYESILRNHGIDAKPEQLIEQGQTDYKILYKEFEAAAQKIAQKLGLQHDDPVSVIQHLKSEQVTDPNEVKKLYEEAARQIRTIVESHNLLTLPDTEYIIRLAGDAESRAIPVPHATFPPLVNNKGERPEYVVPTSSTGSMPFDDVSYEAIALTVTAHEGYPGHVLQIEKILENGVSIIRGKYAFNSTNVEGWAMYAEELMYPYYPLEGQLGFLQMRLWRIARMFLDPMIHLRMIEPKYVIELLTTELGISAVLAQAEVNRYTFRAPGQAASYYYGVLKVRQIRDRAMNVLGEDFNLQCFNDALVNVGLIPLDKVATRLSDELVCPK